MTTLAQFFDRLTGDRRATIDTVTSAPAPLQPIDLTDDPRVTEVLDLAVRVGEVYLASGTAAMDTAEQVSFVAATYGLAQTDVDVTYNSIRLSAYRGPTLPPASTMRTVHYRSMDFTRLSAVDRLTRRIRREMITPKEAHEALTEITTAPHPYHRWIATFAWSAMAASVSILLGGDLLVASVAFLTTAVIDRTNRVLNRWGLPFFFQQVMGGIIAAAPAATLYTFQDQLGIEIRPSQIIAAGVIVLLSGLSLVGSVEDAITGAPVTAAARFFELVMMTGGIIAGVAISLRIMGMFGSTLPPTNVEVVGLARLPIMVAAGAFTALFYALACYVERRALSVAWLGGALGALVYSVAITLAAGPVFASAMAATVVGLVGGLLARRALTPPLIVAVAGITPLLPGLSLYRGLYALLDDEVVVGLTSMLAAFGMGCALAAGVTFGEWIARTLRRPRILRRVDDLRRPVLIRRRKPTVVREPRSRRTRGSGATPKGEGDSSAAALDAAPDPGP
ncbi:threonine/serine exporter family protein [Rhodococcus rhodnii]|uniref:Amino acid export carrier protein n=2 Tax=Rhodococcus rhodnii TaxID=38312 RepID=R7WH36_9NOCA|nr:threonine/serine exporter family protein [Rhodococcus rhodnii]EOM74465.1 amino acid export carrier protein [Rhodococcus rhodnii LMG 5362]TXG89160.1 threonine/serine exporter family protein [Rhodococcus rhodnii]